ncbi:uncharacterized protein LOC132904142 [Amyelois transitella]|uniref:uncharacterized protein LOC132904041 n=1 Tax=Amyelois transitella TaxID=680683 RepID=UPI0029907E51|nr:uncharacterized protein LOC132904041 [Amyelois transitella]XP_060810046.1 uncharacterized protein LOC132904142 [Amyelois transitella]
MNTSGNCTPGTPGCGAPSTSNVNTEIAAFGISSKIPDFWVEMPRVWFAQFEAIMAPQKQDDEAKYAMVLSKIGKEVVRQITDIITAPPEKKKYEAVKERLLSVYEESEERQFQKLVGEMELGDQKPSSLLRRMRELARNSQK